MGIQGENPLRGRSHGTEKYQPARAGEDRRSSGDGGKVGAQRRPSRAVPAPFPGRTPVPRRTPPGLGSSEDALSGLPSPCARQGPFPKRTRKQTHLCGDGLRPRPLSRHSLSSGRLWDKGAGDAGWSRRNWVQVSALTLKGRPCWFLLL